MLHPTSSATVRIIFLYLISNLGKLTATLEGSVSSLDTSNNDIDEISSFELSKMPNKRTYTYVSEYKRLPVYNFGLGKRRSYGDKRLKPYSFGLGKRARGYSFGLGKKSEMPMDMDYPQMNSYESYFNPEMSNSLEEKRNNRLYGFGLGKKSLESVAGLSDYLSANPKRASDDASRKFMFGLGKKSTEDQEMLMS